MLGLACSSASNAGEKLSGSIEVSAGVRRLLNARTMSADSNCSMSLTICRSRSWRSFGAERARPPWQTARFSFDFRSSFRRRPSELQVERREISESARSRQRADRKHCIQPQSAAGS